MRSSMTPPASLSMQLYSALPELGELGDVVGEEVREELADARAARIDRHTCVTRRRCRRRGAPRGALRSATRS